MMNALIAKKRCPRCQSHVFVSRDPLDEPGTVFCMAGHTFVPPNRPANRAGTGVPRPEPAAA